MGIILDKKSDQPGDDVWTEALRIPRGRGGVVAAQGGGYKWKVTGNKAGEIGRGCVRKTARLTRQQVWGSVTPINCSS